MNIQVFGTKKCRETQKAIRFFKERRIKFQFIDLAEKEVSRGELKSMTKSIPLDDLIDKEGKEYKALNLHFIRHNIEEELLEHPLLFKTPVVRNGDRSVAGFREDIIKKWISEG